MNIIKSLECCNNQSKTYLGLCVTTLYLVYKGSCFLLIPCYKNFLKVSFSFLLLIGQLFFPNNEMEVGLYRGGSKRDTLKGQVRISYTQSCYFGYCDTVNSIGSPCAYYMVNSRFFRLYTISSIIFGPFFNIS